MHRLASVSYTHLTADFDVFFKELKQEIELRIPDKFLKAKGWL